MITKGDQILSNMGTQKGPLLKEKVTNLICFLEVYPTFQSQSLLTVPKYWGPKRGPNFENFENFTLHTAAPQNADIFWQGTKKREEKC